jgi:hypothetical protein
MEWHIVVWNLFTWLISLVVLLTVLYALLLLKRITVAIEKIAARGS